MEIITIDSKSFFAKVKDNGMSMWDILEMMIDGKEKLIHFINDDGSLLLQYRLPQDVSKFKKDQKEFAQLIKKALDDNHKAINN